MAQIINKRMTAAIEGDFVVFLIGMRVNKPLKVRTWLPVARAMPRMLRELEQNPQSGLLGYHFQPGFPLLLLVQYWRSFEHLIDYAGSRDAAHFPAWVEFNQKIGSSGDVGIWHETYRVNAGDYETVYNNMPVFGLAKASRAIPATGRMSSAASRIQAARHPVDA